MVAPPRGYFVPGSGKIRGTLIADWMSMPVVQHLGDKGGMADRLVFAAHDAERHATRPSLTHRRDDRVHRPLSRADHVGMSRHQREGDAAIMQDHAAPWRDETRSEIVEQRVDEARRIAVLVDHADIDRVAVGVLRRMGCRFRDGALGDPRPQPAGKALRENVLDVDRAVLRVADRRIAHRIGEPAGFDLQMIAFDRQRIGMHRHALQDVEDEECDDPLAIGWALHDVMAAITGTDGLDIFAARIGEVVERVRPSALAQAGYHFFGDGTGVKGVPPAGGDPLQCVRQRFLAVDAADGRRLAIDQKQATGVGVWRRNRPGAPSRNGPARSPGSRRAPNGWPAGARRRATACHGRAAAAPRHRRRPER